MDVVLKKKKKRGCDITSVPEAVHEDGHNGLRFCQDFNTKLLHSLISPFPNTSSLSVQILGFRVQGHLCGH